jgi:endo-1,4-beta-xylanase
MRCASYAVSIFLLTALPWGACQDQAAPDKPETKPTELLQPSDLASASLYPAQMEDTAILEHAQADGQPVVRVDVKRQLEHVWSAGVRLRSPRAIRKDSVLLLRFKARSQKTAGGALAQFTAVFELGQEPYSKDLYYEVSAGQDPQTFSLPFRARRAYAADEWQVVFHVAGKVQQLELSEVSLTDLGPDADFSKLQNSARSYPGIEADAPWRKAAEARIQKIRMADLKVTVTGADGKPVPGASVKVRQTRHAFQFGAVASAFMLASEPKDEAAKRDLETYKQILCTYFNATSFENALKWQDWVFEKNGPDLAERSLKLFEGNGMPVRGHVLIWPGWKNLPGFLKSLEGSPAHLRELTRYRIFGAVGRFKGRLHEWDVINEPYNNTDLMQVLGYVIMADWFKWAREADPQAKLYLNDFGILTQDVQHQAHLEKTIKFLLEKGAPVDGLGLQGHFNSNPIAPEQILKTLDRFGEFGLPIRITEFDLNSSDEELQALFLRDFYTAAFSHPRVVGIQMWGFWERRHWRPQAALWNADWSIRKHGQAYVDLVTKTWWTNAEGATDATGVYGCRGYLGAYTIEAEAGGKRAQEVLTLDREAAQVELKLAP